MSFATRLRQWDEPLVLYEAVPPAKSASAERLTERAAQVASLLDLQSVDAVNLPEIRVETDTEDRSRGELKNADPREFGRHITNRLDTEFDIVVNHVAVHAPPSAQRRWFKTTYEEYGIDTIVTVGGRSSAVDYPGPSVSDAVELASTVDTTSTVDPCLGGITIPTRRRADFDEPDRMIAKQQAGIEFFTSQVMFNADSVIRLLTDYDAACRAAGIDPAPVFLSFAPITRPNDAQFLEELGVEIPAAVREWMLASDDHTTRRSIQVAHHVLDEVLTTVRREDLTVPVGLNIEHVMRYNIEASERLLDRLVSLLNWHERNDPSPADLVT